MPQNYGFQNQTQQSLDSLLAALQSMAQVFGQQRALAEQKQKQEEAAKQAQGFFTQPTTPTDIPSGIGGIVYPNIQVPTGTPQPNISAMLSALFSTNPYSQQNAKTALGASDMFMPKRQIVNQESGGLQVITTPPFGGEPTFKELAPPRFKPEKELKIRLDKNGNPVTQKFGNDIRVVYDEYIGDKRTGNVEYKTGGNIPSPNAGLTIIQTPEGYGVANKAAGTVSPLINQGGKQQQLAPTSEMRSKANARQLVQTSIDAVKNLSDQIITKVGVAQRASAIKRGAEAVFGSDPQFRTYQDSRMALAGNLAVAQQGSRPSDADIKAIWLPLVPDPYRDTKESAEMKWAMIKTMSLPQQQTTGFQEFNVGGKTYKIPDSEVEKFKKDMGIQ